MLTKCVANLDYSPALSISLALRASWQQGPCGQSQVRGESKDAQIWAKQWTIGAVNPCRMPSHPIRPVVGNPSRHGGMQDPCNVSG